MPLDEKPATKHKSTSAPESLVIKDRTLVRRMLEDFSWLTAGTTILLAAIVGCLVVALIMRVISPKPMIVVQAFETSPEAEKICGMTGKNAEDIFADRINTLISEASDFQGSIYSSKNALHGIRDLPRIPVSTAYGIAIHGISLDDMDHLFARVRYQEWDITGDVFSQQNQCHIRIRLHKGASSDGWDFTPAAGQSTSDAIEKATLAIISSVHPELAGRAVLQEILLQQRDGKDAKPLFQYADETFKHWCVGRPRDNLPYWYLMSAYIFEGKNAEALDISEWLKESTLLKTRVAQNEAVAWKKYFPGEKLKSIEGKQASADQSSEDGIDGLAAIALLKLAGSQEEIDGAKKTLDRLVHKYPRDQSFLTNSAFASDRLAELLNFQTPGQDMGEADKAKVIGYMEESVRLRLRAAVLDPENPGAHLNLGRAEAKLAAMKEAPAEGFSETVYALHLAPDFQAAFEEAQLQAKNRQGGDGASLCETVPLIVPWAGGKPAFACAGADLQTEPAAAP